MLENIICLLIFIILQGFYINSMYELFRGKCLNDLVEGENIKFRSLVFKAKDKSIIKFDQSTYGFIGLVMSSQLQYLVQMGKKVRIINLQHG